MTTQFQKTEALAADYIDQLSSWARIATRPLFGAVALYRNDHLFAMVWHGGLYFKVDDSSRKDYEAAGSLALGQVNKSDAHGLKSYREVPADVTEDGEQLRQWAERAYHAAVKSAKE
ncbi:TfoX/Sxy family protein [Brenneria populi subsp. brevivirga]|uniref:TfoX/Sxy family protein n=1 Tax=Brenneria populi TaxID=1505588 RepID=UPI002E183ED7|nr:TfoX/Sxy family protein [Brenneria populi subsp. brevivirga]